MNNKIYTKEIADFTTTFKYFISKKPNNSQLVTLCIGTDKATGDCLGPLVGSILQSLNINDIYGSLKSPVHALNLEYTVNKIYNSYNNPFIVAVDASLGRYSNIGSINMWEGALSPGSGVSKRLISVGDISVTGIVNSYSYDGFRQLQSSRLSVVMDMAYTISRGIYQSLY